MVTPYCVEIRPLSSFVLHNLLAIALSFGTLMIPHTWRSSRVPGRHSGLADPYFEGVRLDFFPVISSWLTNHCSFSVNHSVGQLSRVVRPYLPFYLAHPTRVQRAGRVCVRHIWMEHFLWASFPLVFSLFTLPTPPLVFVFSACFLWRTEGLLHLNNVMQGRLTG